MRYTNKHKLPIPILWALQNNVYDPGKSDVTASMISDPIYKSQLFKRHYKDIEVDVSTCVHAILGTGVHNVLKEACQGNLNYEDLCEERLYMDVGDYKFSGQPDVIINGIIYDYKTTKAAAAMYGVKKSWSTQLNCLAVLAKENGYKISGLKNVLILVDWAATNLRNRVFIERKYPNYSILEFDVEMKDPKRVKNWMVKKTAQIMGNQVNDPCPVSQRWVNKAGEPLRCMDYCEVSKWCKYWQMEGSKYVRRG